MSGRAPSRATVILKALLLQIIKRLAKYEPEALELLDQVNPPGDPNDSLDGIGDAADEVTAEMAD